MDEDKGNNTKIHEVENSKPNKQNKEFINDPKNFQTKVFTFESPINNYISINNRENRIERVLYFKNLNILVATETRENRNEGNPKTCYIQFFDTSSNQLIHSEDIGRIVIVSLMKYTPKKNSNDKKQLIFYGSQIDQSPQHDNTYLVKFIFDIENSILKSSKSENRQDLWGHGCLKMRQVRAGSDEYIIINRKHVKTISFHQDSVLKEHKGDYFDYFKTHRHNFEFSKKDNEIVYAVGIDIENRIIVYNWKRYTEKTRFLRFHRDSISFLCVYRNRKNQEMLAAGSEKSVIYFYNTVSGFCEKRLFLNHDRAFSHLCVLGFSEFLVIVYSNQKRTISLLGLQNQEGPKVIFSFDSLVDRNTRDSCIVDSKFNEYDGILEIFSQSFKWSCFSCYFFRKIVISGISVSLSDLQKMKELDIQERNQFVVKMINNMNSEDERNKFFLKLKICNKYNSSTEIFAFRSLL